MDKTTFFLKPISELKILNVPFFKQFRPPPSVPIHKFLSRSPWSDSTAALESPFLVVYSVNFPDFNRANPRFVPIHRAPSASSNSEEIESLGNPFLVLKTVKRRPSQWLSPPSSVATHKVPSAADNKTAIALLDSPCFVGSTVRLPFAK